MSSVSSVQSSTVSPAPAQRPPRVEAEDQKEVSRAAAERPAVQQTAPKPVESVSKPTSTMGNNVNVLA